MDSLNPQEDWAFASRRTHVHQHVKFIEACQIFEEFKAIHTIFNHVPSEKKGISKSFDLRSCHVRRIEETKAQRGKRTYLLNRRTNTEQIKTNREAIWLVLNRHLNIEQQPTK